MDAKPRLLDLFCGAGGCAVGYDRAGFEVVGVDIEHQPRFPFEFHQADALRFLAAHGHEFDAIHASPPCQDHSPLTSVAGFHGTGWLLGATRLALSHQERPFVVENVMSAPMRRDLVLCADRHFGLRTVRHRQFELGGFYVPQPYHGAGHSAPTSTRKRRSDFDKGFLISITGDVGSWCGVPCMGIHWMTGDELSQAIPPAYTEFIGRYLIATVAHRWEAA